MSTAANPSRLSPFSTKLIDAGADDARRCSSKTGTSGMQRPRVQGKFLAVGEEKLYVRGVTYGTFRPNEHGQEFCRPDVVEQDFAMMAAAGINAARTYTLPPRWMLDAAQRHGLRVMVGLPWEQHVSFLDSRARRTSIEERIREGVRSCAGHPAVLAYAIGNEIPASIVRWLGRSRVERYLERLYRAAKAEDPGGLTTYVNFPSTEYLSLPFLDFNCFNVYLESQDRLERYLARLHNLAGDRPLVMGEIGLDSRRNGEDTQAQVLDWQIRASFAAGCAGAFVFSWTDEWHRGGHDIDDWDFGLVDRKRRPKPALRAVTNAFEDVPFPAGRSLPSVSVVVCSYNGERTIRDCLDGLQRLDYPDFEVIVVDDGSTDATATIAREYPVRLIRTANGGLSSARNVGMHAATGEIIAYTDDDARPDPHWLTYLVDAFQRSTHVALGGPNIPPEGDGPIAACVANAPGGPIHVLLTDTEAEHLPGCNLAFRRDALLAIGGFDPQFRVAGDDVDVCWRLQERGGTLGFVPAAFVWHHRRNSTRTYWRQQKGYGKAEALLERKWPQKYNSAGHLAWQGRLYGHRLEQAIARRRGLVYHGTWGGALFQSVYQPAPSLLWSLPMMPEWHLGVIALAGLAALGVLWHPLGFLVPVLAVAMAIPVVQAMMAAAASSFPTTPPRRIDRLKLRALTAALHLVQPIARLSGRLRHGLTPWRLGRTLQYALPVPRRVSIWTEQWKSPEDRLSYLEETLSTQGAIVRRGGDHSRWDLAVRGGLFAAVRMLMGVEEHGSGRQYIRLSLRPHFRPLGVVMPAVLVLLAAAAFRDGQLGVALTLTCASALVTFRVGAECAVATGALLGALSRARETWSVATVAASNSDQLEVGDLAAEDCSSEKKRQEVAHPLSPNGYADRIPSSDPSPQASRNPDLGAAVWRTSSRATNR